MNMKTINSIIQK